jgi:hypothetical protein
MLALLVGEIQLEENVAGRDDERVAGFDRLLRLQRPLLDAFGEELRQIGYPLLPARVPGDRLDEVRRRFERSGHGDDLGSQLRNLGRRGPDTHSACLQRFLLGLCRAGGARNDCACMAHRLPGRRREPGDVGNDRF